ncbi:formylglycine-generating enzyme family protein [Tundrisphaera lichenicola]|uniref:formylglycine-generating enzyme family protein n=1 Tax=Tundrisphaera lichenicola TaxID=2029860 RepID=UPI003EBD5C52
MSPRRLVCSTWIVLALISSRSEAVPVVELLGWASEGALISGKGQGPDLILLVADSSWDVSVARDPSRFRVRIVLPGGSVESRNLALNATSGRRRLPIFVTASSVRNLPPGRVKLAISVVDAVSGEVLSNVLEAGIERFPRPRGDASARDFGPFGWGKSMEGPIRILPRNGPDGLTFARVLGEKDAAGFFVATTEATVQQVGTRLQGYDPRADRSDEFALEDPDQPAIGLTPAESLDYLKALGEADPAGLAYRLLTAEEWNRAARSGRSGHFWWGEDPTHPEGANFLGPEPALAVDATATSRPSTHPPTFEANPIGLFHTFGNSAEWATDPEGGFVRMGGHFRTEPASSLPLVKVGGSEELGPDPFVGVRPAFGLTPEAGAALIRKRLVQEARLAGVAVGYDPDRSTVTLTGKVGEVSSRRLADTIVQEFWFVAAVENRLESPKIARGQLANLGPLASPVRLGSSLRGAFLEIPLSVRWFDPLPVAGSEWWVNINLPGGGHLAHKLAEVRPGRSRVVKAVIDLARVSVGLADGPSVVVYLSLGAAAGTPQAPDVVSNPTVIRLVLPARSS